MADVTARQRSTPPVVLSIAGSDASGGAGIQTDLKTFTVLGCYGATAITAITAQNTSGVQHAQALDAVLVGQQIDSVAGDLVIAATKTGMLASAAIIDAVVEAIGRHHLRPLVVDPVMVAKSGDALIDDAAVSRIAERLLPLATLATPNRHEAARLLGLARAIDSVDAAGDAAGQICDRFGCHACIVKGIRLNDAQRRQIVDVLFSEGRTTPYPAPWLDTPRTHGSGCAFSAAITAALAAGHSLDQAIERARAFISRAIAEAPALGHGQPPVSPLAHLPAAAPAVGS